jgi:hypothetical protein
VDDRLRDLVLATFIVRQVGHRTDDFHVMQRHRTAWEVDCNSQKIVMEGIE